MTQVEHPPQTVSSRHLLAGYLAALAAALVLYVATVAPGPLWQDSGMAETRVLNHDLYGLLGLALSHPLYYVFGIAFQSLPFAESAFKTNLVSAVFGAITVANVLLVVRLLTGRWQGAVVGAISLAVAHTFWQHCVLAEVYTVTTSLLTAELLCFLAYQATGKKVWLVALFLVNGLGISNHMLASLSLACWGVWLLIQLARGKVRISIAALAMVGWLAGAALYLGLILSRLAAGDGLAATVQSALVGHFGSSVLNLSLSRRLITNSVLYLGMNFPTPAVLLAFVACIPQRRLPGAAGVRMVIVLVVIYLVWAVRYNVPDQYTFFIPSLPYIAILIGYGANRLLTARPRWLAAAIAVALLPALVYIPLPRIAQRLHVSLGLSRQVPYRDEYSYFLRPWKTGYHGPEQFVAALVKTLPDGAILLADDTTVQPIHYAQLTGKWGRDVTVEPPVATGTRPVAPSEEALRPKILEGMVFVVTPARSYCPEWLYKNYRAEPFGLIYRMVAPAASRPSP